MIEIRRLEDHRDDRALGLSLLREYTEATALEMGVELEVILPYIPDYDDFPGRYRQGGAFLVATVDGKSAGAVGIARLDETRCEMNRLWVSPGFRSLGLGRRLIEASLEQARGFGYRSLALEVLPSREKAIALYRSLGFFDCEPLHEYEFPMVALSIGLETAGVS